MTWWNKSTNNYGFVRIMGSESGVVDGAFLLEKVWTNTKNILRNVGVTRFEKNHTVILVFMFASKLWPLSLVVHYTCIAHLSIALYYLQFKSPSIMNFIVIVLTRRTKVSVIR